MFVHDGGALLGLFILFLSRSRVLRSPPPRLAHVIRNPIFRKSTLVLEAIPYYGIFRYAYSVIRGSMTLEVSSNLREVDKSDQIDNVQKQVNTVNQKWM